MSKSEKSESDNEHPKRQSLFGKFVLILWKNLILRKRHWILSFFELGIPTGLMCLVLFLRTIPDSKLLPVEHKSNTTFLPIDEDYLRNNLCYISDGIWYPFSRTCYYAPISNISSNVSTRRLFWGPSTPFTERMIKTIQEEIFFSDENLQNVSSIQEMDDNVDAAYLEVANSPTAFFVGIFFNLDDLQTDEPPLNLNYDLRLQKFWFTDYVYPFVEIPGPRNYTGDDMNVGGYNRNGFTILQTIIDRAFIEEVSGHTNAVDNYELEVEMYPYPPYVQDHGLSQFYGAVLPTFVVFSLILLSPTLIKSIVHEKETGVRELIRMMGLEGWLIWTGWFMYSFGIIFLSSIIIGVLLKVEITANDANETVVPPILVYSDGFLVFFFIILYGISAICFCFAVSCFFSKPTLATTIGVLIWLLTYFIPRAATDDIYEDLGLGPKLALCLLPNMAITYTFRVIGMFEGRAIGIHWDNLWETGNPRDQLAPAMILLMLAADSVIYIIITWYIDQVLPGTYGVPQPWYFLFQKSYWTQGKQENNKENINLSNMNENTPYTEPEPKGLKAGIKIRNLRKEFKTLKGKIKVAVENVSLTCFKGQCTVLLGHNGAGKTTTMSVLTGVYSPTGGYAEVNGWNIKTNLKESRAEVGLCPQHNTLFTDLSVEQHLLFFARLKGLTRKEAKNEAKTLLHRLSLTDKKDQFGGQLSGGMKRKLCLAIAIIGGSKIIILDEPSSGLDPESRRWVWDVIQKERGSRTVLVTTHHMEEADVLGDRVAIMASGRIFCCGSSLFLKNTFGNGYTLSISGQEDTDVSKLKEVILQYFNEAKLESVNGIFYDFTLPPQTEKFAELLVYLSREKEQLKINHIGLSLTTMEQVFLKVGELMTKSMNEETAATSNIGLQNNGFEIENHNSNKDSLQLTQSAKKNGSKTAFNALENHSSTLVVNESYREYKLKGNSLRVQRFRSLLRKKFLVSIRKWGLILAQSLIPILVTIICLVFDSTFSEETFKENPILLNLSMFDHSFSSLKFDADLEDVAKNYMNLFHDQNKVNITENIESSLLDASLNSLNEYRENYISSAQFAYKNNKVATRMFYQSIPYHPPGIGINLIDNALLHYIAGDNYSITAYNAPLPVNKKWLTDDDQTTYSAILYATMMPLALSFLTSSFLVFPLQERISNAKQIQLMTGTPIKMMWFVTFVWDLLWYSISAILIFMFFMLLDSKEYFTVDNAPGALFLLLILYGFGSIPMAYVFSFPFLSAASGFALLVLVNITAGMIISSVTITLDFFGSDSLMHVSNIIGNITAFVPSYPVSLGFLGIVEVSNYNRVCDLIEPYLLNSLCENLHGFVKNSTYLPCCPRYCEEYGQCFSKISYFQWEYPGIGMYLMYLAVDFFLYFIILYMLEIGLGDLASIKMWKLIRKISPIAKPSESDHIVDDDVEREKLIVQELMHKDDQEGIALVVKDLTKVFDKTGTVAVDRISFHVKRGECFGLLGVNGAGKTTSFRMLTGDEIRSSGDARIGNNFLSHGRIQFMEEIGYCPQFDAIIDELTGEEMLSLMAGLRGVAKWRQPELLSRLISLVDLTECAKRPSATYSGGNKRKLSAAMALVGQPPLVFLDEPTSGVDPASRRKVWEAVRDANRCGQSVILTSHSMDECEALCSNVVIMARGVLKCAGTPKHLKAKFGQGYTLQVKIKTSLSQQLSQDISAEALEEKYIKIVLELKARILSYFAGSTITDEHRGMLAFKVPSTTTWQDIFSKMENLKTGKDEILGGEDYHCLIEDYAAMDPSLEQVFLSFARENEQGQTYKYNTKL